MRVEETIEAVTPGVSQPARSLQTRGVGSRHSAAGWLLAIIALGILLRFAYLGKQSLWVDEVASWHISSTLGGAITAERTNPPLYYILLHFWMATFGTSETAMRSLSAVAGVILIWAVYGLARRLMCREVAVCAALYQSVSSFQIYYSQEARTFSLLALFVVIHAWTLWDALESSSRKRRALFFFASSLSGTIALYLHFIAIFFLAGFGVYVLFRRRSMLLPFLLCDAAALALFSPWLIRMFGAASKGQHRSHLLLKVPQTYFSFLFGDSLIPLDKIAVDHIRQTLLTFFPFLLAALLSVTLLLPAIVSAWRRWGAAMTYAAVGATLPVLLAFCISFKVMLFDERYLIAAAPFLYIVMGAGFAELLTEIPSGRRHAAQAALAIWTALTLWSLYNYYFVARFAKEQWRDAAAYVEQPSSGKTLLLFEPNFIHFNYDYYQKRNLPFAAVDTKNEERSQVAEEIRAAVRGYDAVWVIRSHADDAIVESIVGESFLKDSYHEFPAGEGIEITHLRR